MPRRLRYQVAATLDGFIADPNGGYDWIVPDPAVDFPALYREFDTAVMGRKTFELAEQQDGGAMPGIEVVAFSRSRAPETRPGVRLTGEDPVTVVRELKSRTGKDIWLFGGGELFRTLLDAGLVDTVEIAVMPVLLGAGIPLLPPGGSVKLELSDQKVLPSGVVILAYRVEGSAAAPPKIRYVKSRRKPARTAKKPAKRRRR